MAPDTILIIHEMLCIALFYSVFCRAVRSCEKVRADVRFAFFLLGIVACVGMAAPLTWHFIPDLFTLALMAAVTVVQLVTAQHWAAGVHDRFYKTGHAPRQRRACDLIGGCHRGKN